MIWKTISTNPNYEVSDEGNIRNKKTKKILKGIPDKDGYLKVHLYCPTKNYYVHRLVALAFLEAPKENQTEVHHIDANRQNNNVKNLKWVTRQENDSHVVHKVNSTSYTPIRVYQILNGEIIGEFESMSEAARMTGCNQSHISAVCRGKRKSTGGFQWRKIEGSTTISTDKCLEMEDSLKEDEDIV